MCGAFSGRATSTAAVGVVHDSFISYSDGRCHRWSHNPFCVNRHDIFQNSTAEQRQFNETPSQRHVFCGKRHATASSVATRTGAGARIPNPSCKLSSATRTGLRWANAGEARQREHLARRLGQLEVACGRTCETAAPPHTRREQCANRERRPNRDPSHPTPPEKREPQAPRAPRAPPESRAIPPRQRSANREPPRPRKIKALKRST